MKKIISLLILIIFSIETYSQCALDATLSVDTINCSDTTIITIGNLTSAFDCNFDNTNPICPGWDTTSSAQINANCGNIPAPLPGYANTPAANNNYLWMGNNADVPRAVTTDSMTLTLNDSICFDLVYANMPSGCSNAEEPDLVEEGVSLQYSTDGGITWIDIIYIAPDGNTWPSNPGSGATPYGGPGGMYTWQSYCIPTPAGAQVPNVQVRWIQEFSSTTNFDHWGIDNVYFPILLPVDDVFSTSTDSLLISSTDSLSQAIINVSPTSDSTYSFYSILLNGDTCIANATVFVNPTDVGPDMILDCNQNVVQLQATGVSLLDTYSWSPIIGLSDPNIFNPTASPLDTTDYIFTSSCGADTLTVNVITNYSFSTSNDTTICVGDPLTLEVFGGAQTFVWTTNNNTNSTISDTTIRNPSFSPQNTTTYTVTTDSAGCIKTNSITVTVSNKSFVFITNPPASAGCNGATNGSLTAIAVGALGAFSYTLDDGISPSTTQTSNLFNNLHGGTYTLSYNDTMGCPIDTTIIVPGGLSVSIDSVVSVNPLCAGANNGSISIFVDTNTVVDYSLNGGPIQNSSVFNNLTDGTYFISAQVGTCPAALDTVVLTAPATVTIGLVDSTDLTCGGAGDGEIQVSATNGVSPYLYSIDNVTFSNNGGVISSLNAGTYTVYVRDNNGCKDSLTTSVSEPIPLVLNNIVFNNVLCNGDSTGSISFDVVNGITPYTYTIDSPTFVNTNSFSNLPAGIYNIQAQDDNGCLSAVTTDTITEPSLLVIIIDSTHNSTCGNSDGEIFLSASGGNSSYTYSLDGGTFQNSGTFIGVSSGTHNVVVRDANLCTQTTMVSIADVGSPTLTITMADSISCNGANDASIQLSVSGGAAPYQFSVNGGTLVNDSLFTNLSGGLQSFVVSDNLNCNAIVDTVIFEPSALVVSAIQDSVVCFGNSDGVIHISASGATPPYLYAVDDTSSVQLSSDFTGYVAGTYMAFVMDLNGCIDSVSQVVLEPDTLIVNNINTTNLTCNGIANGQISFDGIGGTPTYSYSIDGGTSFVASNSFTVDTGTFSIMIQDANNCPSELYTTTITQPDSLLLDSVNSINSNCGLDNGSLEVSVTGGTINYSFSLDGGVSQSSFLFSNTSAMEHQVVVTDGNSCTDTIQITVDETPNLELSVSSSTSVSCNGASDATATVLATGGVLPYMYSANGGVAQVSPIFNNLSGGINTFEVTDGLGACTGNDTINIFEPVAIVLSATQDSTSCDESIDGAVHLSVSGGTTPYTYALNDTSMAQLLADFSLLSAGTYMAYVMDFNGCIDSVQQEVFQPDTLEMTSVVVNISCFDDGTITFNNTGGTAPFTYALNGGTSQTSNVFTITSAGIYNLAIADANGCTANGVDSVTAPDPVTFTIDSIVDSTSCNGFNDAFISILADGGTGPYEYSIDNGTTYISSNTFNVSAGTYTLIVKDDFGCPSPTTVVTIFEPNAISLSSQGSSISCFGDSNGTITINTINGGTAPYMVNVNGVDVAFVSNIEFNALAAGTYTITVTDNNACTFTSAETVNDVTDINLVLDNLEDVTCFGAVDGEINVSATGGVPVYTFDLSSGTSSSTVTNNSSASFTNLAGLETGIDYAIVVTDANGCSKNFVQSISQPSQLLIDSIEVNPLSCFGAQDASVLAHVSGGSSPYSYLWTPSNETSNLATGLSPGVHTLITTDVNDCSISMSSTVLSVDPIIATINPDSAFISMGDTVHLSVSITNALSSNLQYQWSPSEGLSCTDCSNPYVTIYNDIEYSVIVTDENGCTNYNANGVYVTVDGTLFFFIPNGFSPSGDGLNDNFRVFGQDIKTVDMMVFNRWGEKVFQGDAQSQPWDGTFQGDLQNPGVYTYTVSITFLNDVTVERKGSVTLVR